ncbi:probable ATP-dependent RNA helicase DDX52 isoform X2 [Bacillus rossius redtenbacheri]|uniref:probable ATP-dependent RNA helicase DDX52 isoform X2 n=1 Tax=Bacillus rossius redtenbacheri TaxID=93214 RepID=UPI002FDE62B2
MVQIFISSLITHAVRRRQVHTLRRQQEMMQPFPIIRIPSMEHEFRKPLPEGVKPEPPGTAGAEPHIKEEENRNKKKLSKAKLAALAQEEVNRLRNEQRISVSGSDITSPLRDFAELSEKYGVSSILVSNLKSSGYTAPTPIQAQAIPLMLQGRQVLACAPTGSGKTAAFLVPVLQQLGRPSRVGVRAVIISPTRELAKQTLRECERLGEGTGLRAHVINKANMQLPGSKAKAIPRCDVLITTPNRLVFMIQQEPPLISLSSVEWLVVDESDKLFEAGTRGFRDQLAVVYNACSSATLKRAMFSATSTPDVARWARKNLRQLALLSVGVRNAAAEEVRQELVFVGSEAGKLVAFRSLVQEGLKPPVLVFVQSKERAKDLFSELLYEGINVDVIHADRTQLQRDNVVRCFREGKIWVLICTELMGRGMDFKGVNLVVNYDFPTSVISYIHRIGRTGRAGQPGRAITFFTEDDSTNLRSPQHWRRRGVWCYRVWSQRSSARPGLVARAVAALPAGQQHCPHREGFRGGCPRLLAEHEEGQQASPEEAGKDRA